MECRVQPYGICRGDYLCKAHRCTNSACYCTVETASTPLDTPVDTAARERYERGFGWALNELCRLEAQGQPHRFAPGIRSLSRMPTSDRFSRSV